MIKNRILIFLISLFFLANVFAHSDLTPTGKAFLERYSKQVKPIPYLKAYSWDQDLKYHHLTNKLTFTNIIAINFKSQNGITDFDEATLYPIINYKINNNALLATLVELNVNNPGGFSAAIKYAEFNWNINFNNIVIAGIFLSPLGKFSNAIYLPWQNKLPIDPLGFDNNEADPMEDIGVQIKGMFPIKSFFNLNYSIFIASSPYVHTSGNNFSYITTNGSPYDRGNHKILGTRVGVLLSSVFEAGFSAALGTVEIFENGIKIYNSRNYSVLGTDLNYTTDKIDIRAEYIQQYIDSGNQNSIPNSAKWKAFYSQASYKLNSFWEIVGRWGLYSPNNEIIQRQLAFGLDYWFTSVNVAKLFYAINQGEQGTPENTNEIGAELAINF